MFLRKKMKNGGILKISLEAMWTLDRKEIWFLSAFSDKSRDYTVPDPSLLAAQGPPTAWQNPQAASMYPGSAPAYHTQVPGGQVPSWDPSLQAVRPSYASAPGTFPVQTGAAPPMPSYAPASAMPVASSPHAQSSPMAHNANPMGIAQLGVPPNVNLQSSGASLSAPGSSPLMQTSQAAQGLLQPNARPGGASPSGQHYYG
ncbi:Polypyrimidine tract-binding 1 [Glycine max]|nr:Polypyrimidine tract-binding 1 [Glycine max]